jgi:WD40 repeat protein
MSLRRMRIFISSPGDVAEERVLANNLVRRLADEFANRLCIEPVFWEHEPLLATGTFQSQIPPPRDCDVVVCILWSRLGTRLPADITRPDGSRYASGTEYEFEDAADGFRANGRPEMLVYRKSADAVVSLKDTKALFDRVAQKEALDSFIEKWFFNMEDGTLKSAFHSFQATAEFERLLEVHLRKLIGRRLPTDDAPTAPQQPSWTAGSPFRGLDVFEFQHSPVFFGRTRAIGDVLNTLRTNAATGRAFVLVVGVSGGGKSSLVRAGVLPVLVQPGVIEGADLWRRAILRPSDGGGDLFRALAAAVLAPLALPELGADGTSVEQLAELLRERRAAFPLLKGGLSQAAATLVHEPRQQQPEARLLVVVDQLEELFTLPHVSAADRSAFFDVLSALCRSGKVWVIATLRGDFYHRAFELPELMALQEGSGLYALPLPAPAEIGQMIRQPARAAGLGFEDDLETRIPLDEVLREAACASPESLPLLEFALEELYQRRTASGLLTYNAYRELRGVEGALTQRAEAVFASLPPDVQATFPSVMRGLVRFGDGEGVVRRQTALEIVAPTPQSRALVEAFVQARLFAADQTQAGQAVVRVTHEALLRNWSRLERWLEHDRELLIVRARVSAAAARWQGEGRRADLLLNEGRPLTEAEALAATLGTELAPEERALIAASQKRRRSRALIKRGAAAALVLLSAAATLAAIYAGVQQSLAENNARTAKANAKRAEKGETEAKQNAIAAELRLAEGLVSQGDALALVGRWGEAKEIYWNAYHKFNELHVSPFRAEVALANAHRFSPPELLTLTGHTGPVQSVAINPDDHTAVSAGMDKTIKLWDLTSGREIRTLTGHTDIIDCVVISPDGRNALSASRDQTLKLWELSTGKVIRTLAGSFSSVTCVAISPNGRMAVSSDTAGQLKLWDLTTGKETRTIEGPTNEHSLAISPDGRMALLGGPGGSTFASLQLWDLTSGERIRTLPGHTNDAQCVAFCPDGHTGVSASVDKTLKVWDLDTGKEIRTLFGHTDWVCGVAVCPDGRSVLSASDDGTLKLWELATGNEIRTFTGHSAGVKCVAISPSGRIAISGSGNGTLKVWDLGIGKEIQTLSGQKGAVTDVSVSQHIPTAISAHEMTLKLWDLVTGREIRTITGHMSGGLRVAICPDGRTAVSAGQDASHALKHWDLVTGKEIRSLRGHSEWILEVAVSPDGRRALSASDDSTLRLWDLTDYREIRTLSGHTGPVDTAAFSRDGRTALSASSNETLTFWDLTTGKLVRTLSHRQGADVVVSATPGANGLVAPAAVRPGFRLWNLIVAEQVHILAGHTGHAGLAAVSPDGRTALSIGLEKTLKLWDMAAREEIRTLSGHADTVYGVVFTPDGRSALSASQDTEVKVWDFSRAAVYLESARTVPAAQATLQKIPDDPVALQVLGELYAFRGVNHWAVELLERARARGGVADSLMLARCYWRLSDDLPQKSTLTRRACLEAARREYARVLERTTNERERFYHQLCFSAVDRAVTSPDGTKATSPEFDFKLEEVEAKLRKSLDSPESLLILGEFSYAESGPSETVIEQMEKARAGGFVVNPVTLGRCYWELSDELSPQSKLTRQSCLESARREYLKALAQAPNDDEKSFLRLCLSAIERSAKRVAENAEKGMPK